LSDSIKTYMAYFAKWFLSY